MKRRRFVSLLGGVALAPFTTLPVRANPPEGCGVLALVRKIRVTNWK
jgi:hypothetical protein